MVKLETTLVCPPSLRRREVRTPGAPAAPSMLTEFCCTELASGGECALWIARDAAGLPGRPPLKSSPPPDPTVSVPLLVVAPVICVCALRTRVVARLLLVTFPSTMVDR